MAQTNLNPTDDKLSPEDVQFAIKKGGMAFLAKGDTTLAIDSLLNEMTIIQTSRKKKSDETTMRDVDHGTRDIPKPKFAVAHVDLNMTVTSQSAESNASFWRQQQ